MSAISAYCKVAIAPVREDAKDTSEMVTQLLFGEMVDVIEEQEKWWKIRTYQDNYVGWVDPKQLRKLSKKEAEKYTIENILKALNQFYGKLAQASEAMNGTAEDALKAKEQIGALANNLGKLNQVYGNMLTAMQGR